MRRFNDLRSIRRNLGLVTLMLIVRLGSFRSFQPVLDGIPRVTGLA